MTDGAEPPQGRSGWFGDAAGELPPARSQPSAAPSGTPPPAAPAPPRAEPGEHIDLDAILKAYASAPASTSRPPWALLGTVGVLAVVVLALAIALHSHGSPRHSGAATPSATTPSSALPATPRASDADAEELARVAETTAITYSTDHAGSFAGLTPAVLSSYESTIPIAPGAGAYVSAAGALSGGSGFAVTATAADGDTFTVSDAGGAITRSCGTAAGGAPAACNASGTW
jgi:hypothetical protein